nr:MFS transporter [Kineosporia mesophila]
MVFFSVTSMAEIVQTLGMYWVTYRLTGNATLVGVVNATAYVPAVLAGLVFRRYADRGHASRLLGLTNRVLLIGSLLLTVVWLAGAPVPAMVGCFLAVQCSLSLVKMLNKAYVGRFVRERFDAAEARALVSRGTSLGLAGGLAGGAVAGILLDVAGPAWCFGLTAGLYALSIIAVRRSLAPGHPADDQTSGQAARGARPRKKPQPTDDADVMVGPRTVLAFSVPSSGALPFISTLMVPLAATLAPGRGAYYSALSMVATVGGFAAGLLVSSERVPMPAVLRHALLLGGVLCLVLAPVHSAAMVLLLMLPVSMVLTAHVICMQVLTNQAPRPEEVGKFTTLRNSVAGAAKAGFSLLAGWVVDARGLDTAWVVLGAVLLVFSVLWWGASLAARERAVRVA